MQNTNIRLQFSPVTGNYEIQHKGFAWVSDGRSPYVLIRKKIGKKYITTYRPLQSALQKSVEQTDDRIICRYSRFVAFGKVLAFTLVCTACITDENTVEFTLAAENEQGFDIQAVYFPAPFNAKAKGRTAYAVDTMRQGFLLPDGYKENILSTLGFANYLRKINTGDCYMPFWGRVSDGHGFCAIVETPYDACMFSALGRHGAFVNSVHWRSSLGKLSYPRKIRYIFHEDCDYNTIAKDYRQDLVAQNALVTMRAKMEKNKNIEKLIGCPVLHHPIFANIQPQSKFYAKDGNNSVLYATFAQRAEQLQKIHAMGLEKLYIHTDGWGEQGYDNLHPYILPPCPAAGGWEGLQQLADTCRNLNYIFALHDQYRDYYYTSKKYDPEKAVTELDGTHPYCSIWDGGAHSFLCATQAPQFVQETYDALAAHNIDVQGAYLDVFSVVPGDECFHPAHTVTREESIRYRAACFDLLNERGIIPSSEEPAAQLLSKLALVHHGPYTARPQENGEAVGIPVPLLSLVFHDCIFIPWNWGITSHQWGIPKTDNPELHCALNAGMPYFHPFQRGSETVGNDPRPADKILLDDDALLEEIKRVQPFAALQAKLYDKEMLRHEFLDGTRRQRTTYADGTCITVDFEQNTYTVQEGTNAET